MGFTSGDFQYEEGWGELTSGLAVPDSVVSKLEGRDRELEYYLAIHSSTKWNDGDGNGDPLAEVWTPVIVQTATPTQTLQAAAWTRVGNTITAVLRVAITSSGTSLGAIEFNLPAIPEETVTHIIGHGYVFFNATAPKTVITAVKNDAVAGTAFCLTPGAGAKLGTTHTDYQLTNGDYVELSLSYEAA